MRYTSEPLLRNTSAAHEQRSDPRLEERAKRLDAEGYAVGLFWIPSQKIAALDTIIDRLQRRAAKLGVQKIVYEKGQPYYTKVPFQTVRAVQGAYGGTEWSSSSRDVRSEVTPVLVAGQEPRLRGWHLVATLEYDEPTSGGEPWVRVMPGRSLPVEFRTVDPTRCDHCNTKRDRTSVFVLGHEDGRYAAVGRTCLLDFMGGHGDPKAAAAGSEILFALFDAARGMEGGEEGGGGLIEAIGLESYLATVASKIREYGWTSRSQAYDTGRASTADLAWLPPKSDVRADDMESAQKTIEWASREFGEPDPSSLTDYGYSCRQVVLSGVASRRSMGVAASLIPAYQRAMAQAAERERSADSQHIGTVGERLVLDLTFTGVRTFDGQYGRTYICMFLDPSGNVVKWFASSWIFDFPFASATGKKVKLKATIKEHGEYKGIKETQLSRAVIATEAEEKPKRRSKTKAGPTTPNRSEDASEAQVAEAMRVLDRDASDGDRLQINRKRGSKRTSRGSKRTSRPSAKRNIGPGAMGHAAGEVIDPDHVRGAGGKGIDSAMDRYETFHAKKPMQVVEVSHEPPEFVVCIGFAVSSSYRTDKWYADGEDTDYKHLHDKEDGRPYHHDLGEGVQFFENASLASPTDVRKNGKTRMPKRYPKAWTRLGKFLGSDIRRNDGSYQEVDSNQSARDCWLLCSPSGDMLAIYSPHPQPDGSEGFLAFMCGGKLRVVAEGIDG